MNFILKSSVERKGLSSYRSFSLRHRFVLFFSLIACCIILTFTVLLVFFDITGSGEKSIYHYLENELIHISQGAREDFGNLTATGIHLAEELGLMSQEYLRKHHLSPSEFLCSSAHMEQLLMEQTKSMISVAEHTACGGLFIIWDDERLPTKNTQDSKTGIFIKRTQPLSTPSVAPKLYYLRGPASIAREHQIELLGQWKMYYQKSELDFFSKTITTAKENISLPISKLYYWSERVGLTQNSEEGLLLCVPIRLTDGTVLGICGIEISDRMFKQLYSPSESTFPGIFTILAPGKEDIFYSDQGLIAGNSYLTGTFVTSPLTSPLNFLDREGEFPFFEGNFGKYGGLSEEFKLYPTGSPYEDMKWYMAVLMPDQLLKNEIKGNSTTLFFIVVLLFILSMVACYFISSSFLKPIKKGLSSIHERAFESEKAEFGVFEIDQLFEVLAKDMRSHKEEIKRLTLEKEKIEMEANRLAYDRKKEIDPADYQIFIDSLSTLTPAETQIFHLYLEGKLPKEILEELGIKENTLKYHNRNIYSKLGVSSTEVKGKFIFFPTVFRKYIFLSVIHIFFHFWHLIHTACSWLSNFLFCGLFFVFTSWQASLPLVQLV